MAKGVKLKKLKGKRKHGFLVRMKTHGGKKIIARRRKAKRRRITL
ncbi:MAG: 50S ribosomal protein L34 [Candidatus Levyibacteriota bacterium]